MASLRAACARLAVPGSGAGVLAASESAMGAFGGAWPQRWLSTSCGAWEAAPGGHQPSTTPLASTSQPDVPLGKNSVVLEGPVPFWPAQPDAQVQARAKYRPWDPTRTLVRKAAYPKRMGFLMQALEEEQVAAVSARRPVPYFESGDILEVTMVVPENQRRQYIYKGVCIARYNKGLRSAFKLYNVYPDGAAVVQHIPLYMPDLVEIKVVGRVHSGSRVKKYHLLENQSSQYTFQRQVKVVRPGAEGGADDKEA